MFNRKNKEKIARLEYELNEEKKKVETRDNFIRTQNESLEIERQKTAELNEKISALKKIFFGKNQGNISERFNKAEKYLLSI